MTKCLCGGDLSTRACKEHGVIIHEDYCTECGKIHDRQFARFPDIRLEHDCIHLDKECAFQFGTKCGAHSTYPDDYEFPKHDFVCVYDIPRPPPKPKQVKMGDLR